jgi:hypothetical protein
VEFAGIGSSECLICHTSAFPPVHYLANRRHRLVGETRAFLRRLAAAAKAVARAKAKQAIENAYQQSLKEAESKKQIVTIKDAKRRREKEGAIDGRSAGARRYHDLVQQFSHSISGEDGVPLNPAEAVLVKQAAALCVRAEAVQADIVSGVALNDEDVVRLNNATLRILSRLERRVKNKNKGSRPGVQGLLQSFDKGGGP